MSLNGEWLTQLSVRRNSLKIKNSRSVLVGNGFKPFPTDVNANFLLFLIESCNCLKDFKRNGEDDGV